MRATRERLRETIGDESYTLFKSYYNKGQHGQRMSCNIHGATEVLIETLRSRFFGISRELQTSSALPLGLRFEVYVSTAKPRSFAY